MVVDNTLGVGLTSSIDWGADIVVLSAAKFVGGHSTSMGGIIVDSGNFDWSNGRFPQFTEPDPSYHGIKFWDTFGQFQEMGNIAFMVKVRVQLQRDIGAALSLFNAFLFLQDLETLPLRAKKHAQNALVLAKYLQDHPSVAWVNYPGLKNHPSYSLAQKYLDGQYGALVGFGIKGGLR